MKKVKWAIWGTGMICNDFATSFKHVTNGELVAVLSRSMEKANAFADKYSIPKRYDDPAKLLADPEIDIIYVGTPNEAHKECVLACIDAGKNILCEKPITPRPEDSKVLFEAAEKKGVFLMEAIWTHFFPVIKKIREWIESGKIGRPMRSNASFGIWSNSPWRFTKKNGGGALLDLGIYCITLTSFAFGLNPRSIKTYATIENGVDIASSSILEYGDDQHAYISCDFRGISDYTAVIQGDEGHIIVHSPFWCPHKAELFAHDKEEIIGKHLVDSIEVPYEPTGLQYEIEAVSNSILEGKIENELMPHSRSLEIGNLMDRIHKEWGINK